MESKMRRFLVLLITLVLLASVMGTVAFAEEAGNQAMPECFVAGDVNGDGIVDQKDAIGVLKHFLFPELYPVSQNQNCDFNGDGEVNTQDAIYVLKSSYPQLFPECVLEGTVHNFYDPAWEWEEVEAEDGSKTWKVTVTFKCGCDQGTHVHSSADAENPVAITSKQTKAPTCVAKGTMTYTAAWGAYTSEKNVDIAATGENGHVMDGTPTCDKGAKCRNCDYEQPELGHKWEKTGYTDATCLTPGTETYTCARGCGAEPQVITLELTEDAKQNLHRYVYTGEVKHEEGSCSYVKVLKCEYCEHVKDGESYNIHQYTATLTQAATCSADGVKTYKCDFCNDSYTESVSKNEAHAWVAGATENGVTAHTCSACGATKTTVAVAEDGTITKEAVAGNQIELDNGATMEMDNSVVENLEEDRDIKVTVQAVNKDTLNNVGAEKLAQIAGDNVYDFSLVYADNGDAVDFNGYITITLPYTLQEGDDVDNINVWYIADNGEVESFKGTYNNGFVTFQTNHFSYYSVTRLTNAQRCELYGHTWNEVHQAATCTSEGRNIKSCQRCGEVEFDWRVAPKGHDYQATGNATAPTCEVDGTTEEKCANCGDVKKGSVPKLGHDYVYSEEKSVEASHTAAGKQVSVCSHCGKESTLEEPQQAHVWKKKVDAATCTVGGVVKNVCECGAEEVLSQTAPLGHNYTKAAWNWAADYNEATATLSCGFDGCGHTLELKAAVERHADSATCTSGGSIRYTGTVSHNGKIFTNEPEAIKTNPADHKPGTELQSNATQHYYTCSECGTKIGAEDHAWGKETVVAAATCVANGKAKQECTVCGYETEKVLPATGEHTYVNGVCSGCGYRENDCKHLRTYKTSVDLSAYNICKGAVINWYTCDCGELKYPSVDMLYCDMAYDEKELVLEDGRTAFVYTRTCIDCGLKFVQTVKHEDDVEACTQHMIVDIQILLGDKVIAEGTYNNPNDYENHPTHLVEENIDLSKYGLCASDWKHYVCYCGQLSTYLFDENPGCEWIRDDENSTETSIRFTCAECGGVMVQEEKITEEDCRVVFETTETYYVNGAAVYTMESCHVMQDHNYQVSKYELYGDSCEDGVLVTQVCADCGKIYEYYNEDHVQINGVTTDLSGYGFCATSMTTYTCPCDEQVKYTFFQYENGPHEWDYMQYQESEDGLSATVLRECRNCGYTVTEQITYTEPNDNCVCEATVVHTFTDGTHTITGYSYSNYVELHDIEQTAALMDGAESCMDGVLVTNTCNRCGYTEQYEEYSHVGFPKQILDVSHLDMCVEQGALYECACGEGNWVQFWDNENAHCEFDWVEGNENHRIQQCRYCQVTMETVKKELERIDQCRIERHYTETLSRPGETPVTVEFDRIDTEHTSLFEFTLLDPAAGCEGGVEMIATCMYCGYEDPYWGTRYDHETWPVERELLNSGDFCGDLYYEKYSCGCGKESGDSISWMNGYCQYDDGYHSEEYDEWVQVCVNCGGERIRTEELTPVEGESCQVDVVWNEIFLLKGKEVASVSGQHTGYSHEGEVVTFELLGDTCDDGYRVNGVCLDCGENMNYYGDEVRYGCESFTVAREVLFEAEGMCSPYILRTNSCACGRQNDTYTNFACNLSWHWDDKLQSSVGECGQCGLKMMSETIYTPVEGETCRQNNTTTFTFMYGENDPVVVEKSWIDQTHRTVTQFYPASQDPNANLCETGYYTTQICVDCGGSWSDPYWIHTGHETKCVEYYDLTAEPFNMCDGTATKYSCACGENVNWYISIHGCRNKAETVGTDPKTGYPIQQCPDCGIQIICGSESYYNSSICARVGEETYVFLRDNTVLLDVWYSWKNEEHQFLALSWSLDNPDGTCEDGYTWTLQCRNCGVTNQVSGSDWHAQYDTQVLKLPDSTCGGMIREGRCACGRDQYVSHEYNCRNFMTTDYLQQTCVDCGLTRVEEIYSEQIDDCRSIWYSVYTYSLNGEELGTFRQEYVEENHTYDYTYTLMDGSVTCEDGVIRTKTCVKCGEVSSDQIFGHETGKIETIALTQYGAEGDTALEIIGCACGHERYYNLTGGESGCDLDHIDTDHWIPGVVDDVYPLFSTSGSYYRLDSYFYDVRCAVTDPQCNFKMRRAEYWLKEGCEAVRYVTYEVYDPATETYVTLVPPTPTGQREDYHLYNVTEKSDYYLDDGTLITYSIERVCPDCGSYYNEIRGVDTNNVQFDKTDAVNTLNNGKDREYHMIYEYGVEYAGNRFQTMQRHERVYAGGGTYWYQYEYSDYNFSGKCTRTETYSNSYGDFWTNENQECHAGYQWKSEIVKEPTCSQPGLQRETQFCCACNYESWSNEYVLNPTEHHNMYWDDAKQMYVCPDCGLELFNYASGTVTMEDMSDDYGNGTDYVIGYWNQDSSKEFLPTLSVILVDATDDNDQLILEFSDFTYLSTSNGDAITAVTFNKALADQAAAAAVAQAGYSGSYSLRFNFVILGGGELDYAITFDPVSTNNA